MHMADELDDLVRRADPDRWLASRFIADDVARRDVLALYAFNHELARAAEAVSQPLIGEMRLAWWREALEEIGRGGAVRAHPVALGLAAPIREGRLAAPALEALALARLRDLDGWPLRQAEVEAYVDATAGAVMAMAAQRLAPGCETRTVRHAGRAWGLAGLLRLGRLPMGPAQTRGETAAALAIANRELADLPIVAFPAVAYASLARVYAAGRRPSEPGKRLRLTWAVARGRV